MAYLRNQEDLAGRLAAFQLPVRFSGFREREGLADLKLQLACCYPIEEVAGAVEHLLTVSHIMCQSRPRYKERAFCAQAPHIERWDRAAGLPEEDHVSPRP